MSLRWLLFDFRGRLNRKPYNIASLIIGITIQILIYFLEGTENLVYLSIILLFICIIIYLTLALQVKRWHDIGRSGWWSISSFIPILGQLCMIVCTVFIKGNDGSNRFGDDPLKRYIKKSHNNAV
jgi:uncharacterized membrane protein YhaH (DUF805 family)